MREDVDSRINRLSKIVQKFPFYTRVYNALGAAYLEKNRASEAIEWFKKGLEINTRYYSLCYGLAMAYNKSGYVDNAIRLSEKALQENPSHHEPYTSLGDAYEAKGNLS